MTEITYLERQKEKDAFNSVMGMVDFLSTSANSPFVSTSSPQKKVSEVSKVNDQKQTSYKYVETRDDGPKRVMFHPHCIAGVDSGEDLAFDLTKVYNAADLKESDQRDTDDEQRDKGILKNPSSKSSTSDARQNFAMNEYQKNRITPTSSNAMRNQDLLKELKVKVPFDRDGQEKSKFGNRWKKKSQADQVAKVLEEETDGFTSNVGGKKPLMSPKKFSVSKINKARTGPVPKSDDFYSELKRWHKDYALRQVEKPEQITIITTQLGKESAQDAKDNASSSTEDVKKAQMNREIEKATTNAKEVLAQQKKTKKQMKKEAKRLEKQNRKVDSVSSVVESTNDDGSTNEIIIGNQGKKEKKKFWKIPMKSKRKQKLEGSVSSNSTGDDSSKSSKSSYTNLGITQASKKVPIKEPEETFNETLDKFLKLQLEMRDEEGSAESDSKKPTTSAVLVETVNSSEESETVEEKSNTSKTEKIEVVGVQGSGTKKQKGLLGKASGIFKKDKKTDPPVTVNVYNNDEKVNEMTEGNVKQEESTSGKEEFPEKATPSQSESTKDSESKPKEREAWLDQIAGLFKTDDGATPPVSIVKVDKFDVDKYESIAVSESKTDTEENSNQQEEITKTVPDTKVEQSVVQDTKTGEDNKGKQSPKLVPNFVVNHQTEGIIRPMQKEDMQQEEETTPPTEEKEEKSFLQSHCPCMPGQQQELATVSTNNNKEQEMQSEPVAESPAKELSWFEMATGFFAIAVTPKQEDSSKEIIEKSKESTDDNAVEDPSTTDSTLLQTPKASNKVFFSAEGDDGDAPNETEQDINSLEPVALPMMPEPAQSGTFDESRSSLQHVATKSETFDDSILTAQDGTFVDSLLTKEKVRSGSYDNSLISLEEGTKVTKIEPTESADKARMESLLDIASNSSSLGLDADKDGQLKKLQQQDDTTESRSCADSQPKEGAAESHPCVDSMSQATKPDPPSSNDENESKKSLSRSVKSSSTPDQASCMESKSKSKNSKSSDSKKMKKKRISKPADIVFFKKNKKNVAAMEDEQASNRAVISSRFSSSGTIFDFPTEDGENRGDKGNQNSNKPGAAALPPLVMKSHTRAADRVASEPWKKIKKVRTKKKVDKGATLFGRLEPLPDEKKRKKKAKKASEC